MRIIPGLAVAAVLSLAGAADAATVTVTIPTDAIDVNAQTATVADLPGPDGEVSLSEALIATNNTPGADRIEFAIPADKWILTFLYPGRAILYSSIGFYHRAYDEVTIDGTTQTAFTGDTNPDGWEVAMYGSGLWLNADHCTLTGFDSATVDVTGSSCLITGNTGFMNITVYGGSGSRIENNSCGTIKIDRSNDNVVVGNTTTRVRVLGWVGGGLPAVGNRIGGPDPADRNFITGYGTVNGEGLPAGTSVQIFDSIGTIVENNRIGTTPDGMAQGSLASTAGVGFEGENHDVVIRDNQIAGILGHGQGPHHAGQLFGSAVLIGGTGSNLTFTGNTLGLDAAGQPTLGSVRGFDIGSFYYLGGMTGIAIGGEGPGEGNVIAGHLLEGIVIGKDTFDARIVNTAVHGNGGLGIDLVASNLSRGVSPNDALDADAGANGLQNFPVLATAEMLGGNLVIDGSLHSAPSQLYTIEFFASAECDPSGHGEGQVVLGRTTVTTNGSGDATFQATVTGGMPAGWFASATATLEPVGATSEFAACVPITGTAAGTAAPELAESVGTGPVLEAASPNPFRGRTTLAFELTRPGTMRLTIHDVSGRLVRVVDAGHCEPGRHEASWDGRRDDGAPAATGVYFARLTAEGRTVTRRTVRLR